MTHPASDFADARFCAICNKPLDLTNCKTDADGKAVHSECLYSLPSHKMFPPPIPEGWAELQQKAQQAKDAAELSRIIEQMNRILDHYGAQYGNDEPESGATPGSIRQKPDG